MVSIPPYPVFRIDAASVLVEVVGGKQRARNRSMLVDLIHDVVCLAAEGMVHSNGVSVRRVIVRDLVEGKVLHGLALAATVCLQTSRYCACRDDGPLHGFACS